MLDGLYSDGRSACAQRVQLQREGDWLCLHGEQLLRRERIASLKLSSQLGTRPRHLYFEDGAVCEVADGEALTQLLHDTMHRSGLLARSERRPLRVALSLLLILLLMGLLVWRGLPLAVQWLLPEVPARWEQALGQQTLAAMDTHLLQPSRLSPARQQDLQRGFGGLARQAGLGSSAQLRFRSSPALGANAFALPGGQVLLLDELVQLADQDQQLLAVLAHELGHVRERHALRLLLQGTAVGALTAWWLGDLSGLLASVPASLLQARYSREFERAADAQAGIWLQAQGIAPQQLAQMLRKLAALQARGGQGGGLLDSHPALAERISRIDGQLDERR